MNVLIDLDKDILKWAAIEAAKTGISRKKFLSKLIGIEYTREKIRSYEPNIQFVKSNKKEDDK